MELYKPPIILLTETWLTPALPDGLVSLENDSLFRNYRMHMKEDGVCIYFSKYVLPNFQVTPLSSDKCGIEALFLKLANNVCYFCYGLCI